MAGRLLAAGFPVWNKKAAAGLGLSAAAFFILLFYEQAPDDHAFCGSYPVLVLRIDQCLAGAKASVSSTSTVFSLRRNSRSYSTGTMNRVSSVA